MVAAVLLVCDFLFDSVVATLVAGVLGSLYVGLWFVFPLMRRLPLGDGG
jgi:hypothetical protein